QTNLGGSDLHLSAAIGVGPQAAAQRKRTVERRRYPILDTARLEGNASAQIAEPGCASRWIDGLLILCPYGHDRERQTRCRRCQFCSHSILSVGIACCC